MYSVLMVTLAVYLTTSSALKFPSRKKHAPNLTIDEYGLVDKEQIDDLVQRMYWEAWEDGHGLPHPNATWDELDPAKKFGYKKRPRIIDTATKRYKPRNPAKPRPKTITTVKEGAYTRPPGEGKVVGRKGYIVRPKYKGPKDPRTRKPNSKSYHRIPKSRPKQAIPKGRRVAKFPKTTPTTTEKI